MGGQLGTVSAETDTEPDNELSGEIIGAAIEVHDEIGPGLLEKTYQRFFRHELRIRGLSVDTEVTLPIRYKGLEVPSAYRVDLLVEDEIVVEVKAVRELLPVHDAQILTYMELLEAPLGLLINFYTDKLVEGVRRKIR